MVGVTELRTLTVECFIFVKKLNLIQTQNIFLQKPALKRRKKDLPDSSRNLSRFSMKISKF